MSGRRTDTHRRHREDGASAVEFALILPVFVLIIAAIIDFGFIFAQQVSLNNAARAAPRAGVVKAVGGTPKQCQQIVSAARDGMGNTLGLGSNTNVVGVTVTAPVSTNGCTAPPSGSTSSTSLPCGGSSTGQALTVTLAYTSQALIPLPYLNSKVLTAKGVFQCEYN